MGEYAERKQDGVHVKIGTCEDMCIRYEDRTKFRKVDNSVDPATAKGCRWRLPLPEEDGVEPGDYETEGTVPLIGYYEQMDFSDGNWNAGFLQFTHSMGLLISVPCYHAQKLPAIPKAYRATANECEISINWNGHDSNAFVLSGVKNMPDGEIMAIVMCKHCRSIWRFPMSEVLPYVKDEELKRRLIAYNAPKPEPVKPVVQTPNTTAKQPAGKQPKRKGSMDWSEMFG